MKKRTVLRLVGAPLPRVILSRMDVFTTAAAFLILGLGIGAKSGWIPAPAPSEAHRYLQVSETQIADLRMGCLRADDPTLTVDRETWRHVPAGFSGPACPTATASR